MRLLYALLAGACIASATYYDKPNYKKKGPLVKLKMGYVMGKYVKVSDIKVATFVGIPFATAPIRFAKPQAAKPWKKVLNATEKPPQCPQYYPRNYDWIPVDGKNSEDCLYLNVWSPSVNSRGYSRTLPVMVWIHGGGFIVGSSSMDVYDGSTLASYGDVVVVTMNYRVGVFGFLSSGTEDVPGNAGFYDQVMALEWVRDNIEQFGGDPDSVTLLGESAGGACVSAHQVSPLSNGLFHRLVLMSGTAYQPYVTDTFAMAQSKLKIFSEAVGCSGDSITLQDNMAQIVQCLRDTDVDTLLRAQYEIVSGIPLFFVFYAGGEAFPKHPIEAYDSGDVNQVEILTGDVKDEGTIFLNLMMPDVFRVDDLPDFLTSEQIDAMIPKLLPPTGVPSTEEVKEFYFGNFDFSDTDEEEVARTLGYIIGDFLCNCPQLYFAEKVENVYFYWDTHHSTKDKRDPWLGTYHFTDVPYVFGQPIVDSSNFTSKDGTLSKDIIQTLANFASTGYPLDPDGEVDWPKFDSNDPLVHVFSLRQKKTIRHPRADACEFWRPYLTKPL